MNHSCDLPRTKGNKRFHFERFHNGTKLPALAPAWMKREQKYRIGHKRYEGVPAIALPEPQLKKSDLAETLRSRKSQREFDAHTLNLARIGTVLGLSCGINESRDVPERRYYPSAGALYPLETYAIVMHAEIPSGLYHYRVTEHVLEQVNTTEEFDYASCFSQKELAQAGMIVVITACIGRTLRKYGERAYRYVFIEAGHLGQNISLVSTALGLKSCATAGYYDDALEKYMGLKRGEIAVYCFAGG